MKVFEGKWISIEELDVDYKKKKTKEFEVYNHFDKTVLGIIKWRGSWRKYAFFPHPDTFFEWVCMTDIGNFCKEETKRYKDENWVKL